MPPSSLFAILADAPKDFMHRSLCSLPELGLTPWRLVGLAGFLIAGLPLLLVFFRTSRGRRPLLSLFSGGLLALGLTLCAIFLAGAGMVSPWWNQPFPAVEVTPWKIIGYAGTALFTGRWLIQLYFSRKAGRPVVPLPYWIMSIGGSLLLLAYFIFGKTDSVGVLNNLFPACVAAYNLNLELTLRRRQREEQASLGALPGEPLPSK